MAALIINCLPQNKSKSTLTADLCKQLIAFGFLLEISVSGAMAADAAKPLNLLIITADDMNADSGGWIGNTLGATPNLDAFAKTAHRFLNSHVTVPVCLLRSPIEGGNSSAMQCIALLPRV